MESRATSTAYLREQSTAPVFFFRGLRAAAHVAATGTGGKRVRQAQCVTIRLKLLKIRALIRLTVRKVWVSLAGGYPYAELFRRIPSQVDCATAEGLKDQDLHTTLVLVLCSPGRGVPKLALRDRKQSLRPSQPWSVTRPCLANIPLPPAWPICTSPARCSEKRRLRARFLLP